MSGADARPGRLVGAGQRGVPVGCVQIGECDRALVSSLSLSPLTLTWFPTNVACNSHVNLLNIEVESLE